MYFKKFLSVLIGLLIMNSAFGDFAADINRARNNGFDISEFSHANEHIRVTKEVTTLSFPLDGKVVSSKDVISSAVLYGQKVYPSQGYVFRNLGDHVEFDFRFLVPGENEVLVIVRTSDSKGLGIGYVFDVPENKTYDQMPPQKADNLPVIPTGYMYRYGIFLRNFDKQYLFNNASKEWSVSYKGVLPQGTHFSVTRVGEDFDVDNILTQSSNGRTKVSFSFPDLGVYHVRMYGASSELLAMWKVRNDTANPKAKPSKPRNDVYSGTNVNLAKIVQDIPFEWETDVETLAKNLKQGASTEGELQEIIYDWVTQNLSYDYYTLEDWKPDADLSFQGLSRKTHHDSLAYRTAICAVYSELSQRLSALCGLEDYYVGGSVLRSDKSGPPAWGSHAWNAVKIDGEWFYYDTTWNISRRKILDFESTRGLDSIYLFNNSASGFTYCEPESPSVSEIAQNLSQSGNAHVLTMPDFGPYDFVAELGFNLTNLSHKTFKFETKKTFPMTFRAQSGLKVEAAYAPLGSWEFESAGTVKESKGNYTAQITLPQNGSYALNIRAQEQSGLKRMATLTYLVSAVNTPSVSKSPEQNTVLSGNYATMIDGHKVTLKLSTKDGKVVGEFSEVGIKIAGTFDGQTLFGNWELDPAKKGWIFMQIAADDGSIAGTWGATADHNIGEWKATRLP